MTKIVIVGDSPRSFLIARQLDQDLARLSHAEVTLIRQDFNLIYWPGLTSLVGSKDFVDAASKLKNVNVQSTNIRQINLADRRIITTTGQIDYDWLILDPTPVFTSVDIAKISSQIQRLLVRAQAKLKTVKAPRWQVNFSGHDPQSLQLALALTTDLRAHPAALQRAISVQVPKPSNVALQEFLTQGDIKLGDSSSSAPGLTIGLPASPVPARLVRGAQVDAKNNFVINNVLMFENIDNCFVVSQPNLLTGQIWADEQKLAMQVVSNIEAVLAGHKAQPVSLPLPAGLLIGLTEAFSWTSNSHNWRWQANLAAAADKRFFQQVLA